MNSIKITFKKELRSMFRDKKTFYTLLIFPILIPCMIFLYAYMYEDSADDSKYLIGINFDTNSVMESFMSEVNIEPMEMENLDEMESAYNAKEIAGYIYYDEMEDKYTFYTNEDSEEGMYASSYVVSFFENYNNYLGRLYLIGEDIDVDTIYSNVSYEVVDLEGENWMLELMFVIAFTYIVMAIVMSTTNMATNATAVEKENGTLETLLTFPIRSRDLIIGKYLATVFMGVLAAMIGLVLTVGSLVISTKMFSVLAEISFRVSLGGILLSSMIVVLASCFIGGLSILVVSMAKSYKEAQSMSSVLNMLTVIPMMISIFGVSVSRFYYLIPIFNYTQILMDIFSGNYDFVSVMMVIVSSFVYVVLVIYYIIRQYKTERVLFGINS